MVGQARLQRWFTRATVLIVAILAASFARGDLQIAGYEDRLHDRFYVGSDRAFIGDKLQLVRVSGGSKTRPRRAAIGNS